MDERVSVLTGELHGLQEKLNVTTDPEAHTALLTEIRSKLKELDQLVKSRLERVYGLSASRDDGAEQPDRNYDIFERLPDGGVRWRGVIAGEDDALAKLRELAQVTENELFACNLRTNKTIARANVQPEDEMDASKTGSETNQN